MRIDHLGNVAIGGEVKLGDSILHLTQSADPVLTFYQSGSSSNGTAIARIDFKGLDVTTTKLTYADIEAVTVSNSTTSGYGRLRFSALTNGSPVNVCSMRGNSFEVYVSESLFGNQGVTNGIVKINGSASTGGTLSIFNDSAGDTVFDSWDLKSTTSGTTADLTLSQSTGGVGNIIKFLSTGDVNIVNNVGIGTTDPDGQLHLFVSSPGTSTAVSTSDNLIIEENGSCGMTIISGSTPDFTVSLII